MPHPYDTFKFGFSSERPFRSLRCILERVTTPVNGICDYHMKLDIADGLEHRSIQRNIYSVPQIKSPLDGIAFVLAAYPELNSFDVAPVSSPDPADELRKAVES